jgi:hypothetical protein
VPPATSAVAPSFEADRAAIIKTAERFFDGMRTRDTAALRALLDPELVMIAVLDSAGVEVIERMRVPAFLHAVATAPEELRERIWSPEVRIAGPVATLWAPYDFHFGESFSHCGHDAFQFVRTLAGWSITGLSYTIRPVDCPRGSVGHPSG